VQQYHNLVKYVLENGTPSDDRTGTGTYSVFGAQTRYDLSKGFPLLTTKYTYWRGVLVELLWFLRGDTNISWLQERNVHIWDSWHDSGNTIGKGYSYQWRNSEKIDLVKPRRSEYTISENQKNPKANILGVAYGCTKDRDDHIYNVWSEMIHRCYNPNRKHYKWYGGSGVKVCDRWLYYDNFTEDFYKIENSNRKKQNIKEYSLDKDYYGSNVYAPDVCIWLSKEEQRINTSRTKLIQVTMPGGEIDRIVDLKNFCFRYKLDYSTVTKCIRKERESHKGFKFEDITPPDRLVRCRKIDQIQDAINEIKNNPNSRRNIVTAWNSIDIDQMALPPCHTIFQFYVKNNKLSCQLYQRSADLFLGVPFNIASYAALTHLIANDAGLEVGDFVHTFGDLHIYNNHIPQCEELLQREEHPLPKLEVNLQKDDLMSFVDEKCHKMNWEEISQIIKLTGYKHSGKLKGEVSV